jgi:hypothetical protein
MSHVGSAAMNNPSRQEGAISGNAGDLAAGATLGDVGVIHQLLRAIVRPEPIEHNDVGYPVVPVHYERRSAVHPAGAKQQVKRQPDGYRSSRLGPE